MAGIPGRAKKPHPHRHGRARMGLAADDVARKACTIDAMNLRPQLVTACQWCGKPLPVPVLRRAFTPWARCGEGKACRLRAAASPLNRSRCGEAGRKAIASNRNNP